MKESVICSYVIPGKGRVRSAVHAGGRVQCSAKPRPAPHRTAPPPRHATPRRSGICANVVTSLPTTLLILPSSPSSPLSYSHFFFSLSLSHFLSPSQSCLHSFLLSSSLAIFSCSPFLPLSCSFPIPHSSPLHSSSALLFLSFPSSLIPLPLSSLPSPASCNNTN